MNTVESNAQAGQMKALRAHARGGAEQLVYEDAPVPEPPRGSIVCVRVKAVAVTLDELTWEETWEADGVDRTPIIPSHEFSGVVVAVGPEAHGIAVGDEVFGLVPFNSDGAAAEYVLVPSASLAVRPAGVSDVVAAAAVLPALTAMEALEEALGLLPGQRLLVRGGTGAVASFLTQFAHRMGLSVSVTVRSPTAVERAKRLGADQVLVADEPAGIPAGSFDASIDGVGAGTPEWMYCAVRPGGRVITLQEAPDADLARKFGVDARFFLVEARPDALNRLAAHLATGDLEVAVAQVCPLSEGRAAYAGSERPQKFGKTVLDVAMRDS
jgi:NADPH:quinone reductase-like Zn-dependent oxidoreductase